MVKLLLFCSWKILSYKFYYEFMDVFTTTEHRTASDLPRKDLLFPYAYASDTYQCRYTFIHGKLSWLESPKKTNLRTSILFKFHRRGSIKSQQIFQPESTKDSILNPLHIHIGRFKSFRTFRANSGPFTHILRWSGAFFTFRIFSTSSLVGKCALRFPPLIFELFRCTGA